ncbi:hypothetical protein PCE1_000191 [Barthelona sp. PCE]
MRKIALNLKQKLQPYQSAQYSELFEKIEFELFEFEQRFPGLDIRIPKEGIFLRAGPYCPFECFVPRNIADWPSSVCATTERTCCRDPRLLEHFHTVITSIFAMIQSEFPDNFEINEDFRAYETPPSVSPSTYKCNDWHKVETPRYAHKPAKAMDERYSPSSGLGAYDEMEYHDF